MPRLHENERLFTDWTDERKAFARDLWGKGHSASQIAAQLDVPATRNSVIGIVTRGKFERPVKVANGRQRPPPKKKIKPPPPVVVEPPPPPPPSPPSPPATFLGLTLWELRDDQCHYPRGDQPPMTYCGQPVIGRGAYCTECSRTMFTERTHGRHAGEEAQKVPNIPWHQARG